MSRYPLTLALIRHGRAESFSDHGDDFHRRLAQEGVSDVIASAKQYALLPEFRKPDVIFTSPAVRARSTALILAKAYSVPDELVMDEPLLYTSDGPGGFLAFIRHLNSDFKHIVVAGHYPLIPETVEILTRRGVASYGTGSLSLLGSEAEDWSEAVRRPFELIFKYDPADLLLKGRTI